MKKLLELKQKSHEWADHPQILKLAHVAITLGFSHSASRPRQALEKVSVYIYVSVSCCSPVLTWEVYFSSIMIQLNCDTQKKIHDKGSLKILLYYFPWFLSVCRVSGHFHWIKKRQREIQVTLTQTMVCMHVGLSLHRCVNKHWIVWLHGSSCRKTLVGSTQLLLQLDLRIPSEESPPQDDIK